MPNFGSNDPNQFGWSLQSIDILPFVFRGHTFYSGVDRRAVGVFTTFLERLVAVPGFALHSGSGANDGDWGYEDRNVRGGNSKSFHAFGLAIDINAPWNPLGVTNPSPSLYRLPSVTDNLALGLGLLWGGNIRFASRYDRMHVEVHCSPAELAAGRSGTTPGTFPLPSGSWFGQNGSGAHAVSGYGATAGNRFEIQQIQRRLNLPADGLFGPHTFAAVVSWQRAHRLVPDGLVGPLTWASLGL